MSGDAKRLMDPHAKAYDAHSKTVGFWMGGLAAFRTRTDEGTCPAVPSGQTAWPDSNITLMY